MGQTIFKKAQCCASRGADRPTKYDSLHRETPEARMKRLNIVGPQVRRLRTALHWTQEDLATKLQRAGWDISRSGVAKVELQCRGVPDLNLKHLAQALGVAVVALF